MALGRLGKYERVDVLGHGASGIVYLAWDTLLKKQVALKEIDLQAADVDRFLEEARVMDRLQHPNIVHVNSVDRIDGRVLIDMEYVKGKNLQQILREEGRLSLDRALDIAIQVLDALDYAHSRRTVHRDIKPANILLNRAGQVKLVDFGLAEVLASNSYAGGAGTYAYMAPEDFAEERHSDHRSDLWAVAVTLYEMVTGRRPFNVPRARDPFAWRSVLLNDRSIPLTEALPDEEREGASCRTLESLQRVLDRALAREKQERYQSAREFKEDLEAIRQQREPVFCLAPQADRADRLPLTESGTVCKAAAVVAATSPTKAETDKKRVAARIRTAEQAEGAPVSRPRFPLAVLKRHREVAPARVKVEPQALDIGAVRKGDERRARFEVRIEGGEGRMSGRVVSAPPWVEVEPVEFRRRKQRFGVRIHTGRVWQTGEFEETIILETDGGTARLPVRVQILKPRPRFGEVAFWFLPALLSVLLPTLAVVWGAEDPAARFLVPAAALASGLLSLMLFCVAVEAELGFVERLICGALVAVMSMALGVSVGIAQRTGDRGALMPLLGTGVPIGLMLLLQTVSHKHWRIWVGVIILLALIAAGTLTRTITGRL